MKCLLRVFDWVIDFQCLQVQEDLLWAMQGCLFAPLVNTGIPVLILNIGIPSIKYNCTWAPPSTIDWFKSKIELFVTNISIV